MYLITDRQNAIKAVQKFLGLNQTGVFNTKLRDMVTKTQKENDLEVTGIVNYETFNFLKTKYLEKLTQPTIFSALVYEMGDMGEEVAIINALLANVIQNYTFEGIVPKGYYYGQKTADAVVRLREIFMLRPSNNVDKEFLARLLLEKNAINLSQNNS